MRSPELFHQRDRDEKPLRRMARQTYYRFYGKVPRVRLLHPYFAAMRHLIRAVERAAHRGAANVLVVIGGGGVTDSMADHLPGFHAQVAFSELIAPSFKWKWDQVKFDLCICTLGGAELAQFSDLVIAVAPHMSEGGKILGFYPNFSGRAFFTSEMAFLQNLVSPPWSAKLYYAGSDRSVSAIRQFHAIMFSDPTSIRFKRIPIALLAMTPKALVANISESLGSCLQAAQIPARCTSVTIEINAGAGTSDLKGALHREGRFQIVLDARQHLEQALSRIAPNQPSYGKRWQPQADAIRRAIPALADSVACIHYAQKEIRFDGRPPFPKEIREIQLREWAVENEFPNLISTLREMYDDPLSYPESLGDFNGRRVSQIFYCHARIVLAGITYASKPKRILEIGGGYGEIARLWVTNTFAPAESYVIVDIPESLFFAEVALRAEFGDQVGYFDGQDPGTKILLVPIPLLGALTRPSDLVINTGSMQEMTDEWIDFYTQWLANYDTRYFYSLNYIAQPIQLMGESCSFWTQRLGRDWSTRHLRLNIPLVDLEGPTRDFLEGLYEKSPATRSLKDWSAYHGHLVSKPTYVEGLDLLRQDFTIDNAKKFVRSVFEHLPYRPKELLYIVEWLKRQGDNEFESLRGELQAELGGFIAHEPAAPKAS